MVMTDPIADFLTRVRNANMALKETVEIPASNIKKEIAQIMKDEGYIKDYEYIEDGRQGILRLYLKYKDGGKRRVISGMKKISKPGLRVYANKDEIPRVLGGLGIAIISTSKGVYTDKRAREEKIGGEVLCYIW